jgi:cytochrome c biogenesis protein CcmG, thiol:disulfide interchange protein DsbE
MVTGALRMKRVSNFLILLASLAVLSAGVSGCNSRGWFKALAEEKGTGSKVSANANLPSEPDVTFKNLDGQNVTLGEFKGKVVVVNFWATWCEPCQTEIPWMIGFQEKYAGQGFTMLGVAMDDEGKSVVEPYVQKTQFDVDGHSMTMNYPIVLGNDDLASKFGGLIGLPTTIVINRDGKIAKRFIGIVSHDELEKEIKALL